MQVVDVFPVRDILFHLARGTMNVETRAIGEPGERKEGRREGGKEGEWSG